MHAVRDDVTHGGDGRHGLQTYLRGVVLVLGLDLDVIEAGHAEGLQLHAALVLGRETCSNDGRTATCVVQCGDTCIIKGHLHDGYYSICHCVVVMLTRTVLSSSLDW